MIRAQTLLLNAKIVLGDTTAQFFALVAHSSTVLATVSSKFVGKYCCKESKTEEIKLDDDHPKAVETLPIYLCTLSARVFGDSAESYNKAWHAFVVGDKYGVEILKNDGGAWFIEKMNACLPAYNTRGAAAQKG